MVGASVLALGPEVLGNSVEVAETLWGEGAGVEVLKSWGE